MHIYIVSSGEYSDYHIYGIYSTYDKAVNAVRFYGANNDIEVVDLDPDTPYVDPEKSRWSLAYFLNCQRMQCGLVSQTPDEYDYVPRNNLVYHTGVLNGTVLAGSNEDARKIFTDRVRAFIAGQTFADNYICPGQDVMCVGNEIVFINNASTD